MKIKSIHLEDFKRFKDLTVSGLPETAKLIVLVGPNGCGKSSLFDAIYGKMMSRSVGLDSSFGSYYDRVSTRSDYQHVLDKVDLSFYGNQPKSQTDYRKAVYVRSAYRNDPSFSIDRLTKVSSALEEIRIMRMIDNDQSANLNYTRLVSQAIEDLFEKEKDTKNIREFREEILADTRDAVHELFPELILNSLGNPLEGNATFRFDKGDANKFTYENLSGGEKAAFDLILDLVVKRREFDDTVFCIDEPEAHMGMRVQQKLLKSLYELIPDNCQLWIATHSIGMMREAYNLQRSNPKKVVFLDFDNLDFDKPQLIEPVEMNRAMWEQMHSVTLDDLADLVFPDKLYLCESTPEKSFDADCYNTIFSSTHPEVKFVSIGSKKDVVRVALILQTAMPGLSIIPLRDRDQMADPEISDERSKGVKILSLTCIEAYLLDDEVLEEFCRKHDFDENILQDIKQIRDGSKNNAKKAAQDIRTHLVNLDKSLLIGDNREAFLKYSLAPLLNPKMQIYQTLESDIFGEG